MFTHHKSFLKIALVVASVFVLSTQSEENVDEYQLVQNQAYLSPISGIDLGMHFDPPIHRRLRRKSNKKKSNSNERPKKNSKKCKKTKKGKKKCGDGTCFSFQHGVASGDATSTAIMVWTRVSPDPSHPECRRCTPQVLLKMNGGGTSKKRRLRTSRNVDYTVKIDVTGLPPNTAFEYQFTVGCAKSTVGRTKTLPSPNVAASDLSIHFAQVSCQSYTSGYFLAYRDIAQNDDIDFVVHHGDTIYEGTSNGTFPITWPDRPRERDHKPEKEIYTLDEYRTRHGQYKTDENYQAALAAKPFYFIWDDHEVVNDFWTTGAETNNASILSFSERKRNGIRAFYEWNPVRRVSASDFFKAYRAYSVGQLMELTLLDSRAFNRTRQKSSFLESFLAPSTEHHLIGNEQRDFLFSKVRESVTRGTVWQAIANAVTLSTGHPLQISEQFWPLAGRDGWLGYYQERLLILKELKRSRKNSSLVFLAGDSHSFVLSRIVETIDYVAYAIETNNGQTVAFDVGSRVASDPVIGIEVMTGSVTSPGAETLGEPLLSGFESISAAEWGYLNPWFNFRQRGYVVNIVTDKNWRTDLYVYNDVTNASDPVKLLESRCWEANSYNSSMC